MKRINVVYSIISNETRTKILMVRNVDNGEWSLPGGAVEDNESLEFAAIREAKEETGYDIKVYGIVALNEAKLLKHNEHALFITFRAEIVGGTCNISRPDEINKIEWVDIDKADKLMPYYNGSLRTIAKDEIQIPYFNQGTVS